jgi:1-acyl-sn-glycerol-3-phosphate acyltransferase
MHIYWIFAISRVIFKIVCRVYFRIEFSGTGNIPSSGPFILAPNHVSYMDPIWVSIPVSRPMRYMTWDEMTKKPLIGPLMKAYGAFPVHLERADRTALRKAGEQLRTGGGLVIFPEGGRTRDGLLARFKPGVIRLAAEADVPIVPATIIGGYAAYNYHHLLPRPRKVRVIYHPPIRLTLPADGEISKEFLREEATRLHDVVLSGLPSQG